MRTEKVEVNLLEKGDFVFTPAGIARVTENEVFDERDRYVFVEFLESTSEHSKGEIKEVESSCCLFDWSGKEKDINALGL